MKYFIGIDAGATGTEVLIAGHNGKIRSLKKFQPVNYNLLGFDKASRRLTAIIKDSLANIPSKSEIFIAACVSGAGDEKARKKLSRFILEKLKIKKLKIYPDTSAAFASVFSPDDTNCGVLIAGTGSVLYYKDRNGKTAKVGGWGRLIGDEGSGYWIAREALGRVTRYYDSRGRKTKLSGVLQKKFHITQPDIIKKIYHNNFEISRIANLVFDCAEKDDNVSKNIIKEAAEHLVQHLEPLKHRHFRIALCGSLFSQEKLLEKYFRNISKKRFPGIILIKPELRPVWGALKLAMLDITVYPFRGEIG